MSHKYVVTYRLAYLPGEITLCARCASDPRRLDYADIGVLGDVNWGAHIGWCDACHQRQGLVTE